MLTEEGIKWTYWVLGAMILFFGLVRVVDIALLLPLAAATLFALDKINDDENGRG